VQIELDEKEVNAYIHMYDLFHYLVEIFAQVADEHWNGLKPNDKVQMSLKTDEKGLNEVATPLISYRDWRPAMLMEILEKVLTG